MDITAALSSAKTTFELARALQNGLARQQVKPEEVPARLMELQQHILSMQAVIHDLAAENRELAMKLEAADKTQEVEESLIYGDHVYFRRKAGGGIDGPFCTTCWDDSKKLVRLKFEGEGDYSMQGKHDVRYYTCTIHKTDFFIRREIFREYIIS
jgi:hypothetical protein